MNRIIIIGNGFDIAHGFPTAYTNFIEYLKHEYIEFLNSWGNKAGLPSHTLFDLKPASPITERLYKRNLKLEFKSDTPLERWDDISSVSICYEWSNSEVAYVYNPESYLVAVAHKNKMLGYVFEKASTKDWGGFENDYKNVLSRLINGKNPFEESQNSKTKYNIKDLNQDISQIINLLHNYLSSNVDSNIAYRPQILSKLYTKPLEIWRSPSHRDGKYGRIPKIGGSKFSTSLDHVLFVSFNYTATAEAYLVKEKRWENFRTHLEINQDEMDEKGLHKPITSIRYIHGDLSDGDPESLIFGYGDEMDESQNILEAQNNEYFKHIKSVLYTRTPYYRELIDFADADKFDVVIYGHSCSNTDRTLLNTLFEHENCVSIQPFLHDKQDTSIYINIYRCFKDKALMRSRVVDQTNTIKSWD